MVKLTADCEIRLLNATMKDRNEQIAKDRRENLWPENAQEAILLTRVHFLNAKVKMQNKCDECDKKVCILEL